ncbi:hypothetical protein H5V45_10490 [Nocardioides sp. KIGAM211]|uniref:Uncharacterized protein n=1 Tax=Nocardioides luti TaxID=2761101 RepID=A0A7X0VC08_9ACTN|nr:hypothetical protein [Nocardioides luti]MBB6627748.1 hypothetical protein [Nocardioides luti]
MITPRRQLSTLALATAALAVTFSSVAAPADAAGRHFGDVATYYKATIQSCKTSIEDGTKWRIFMRLDNTANRPALKRSGSVIVVKNGETTDRRIDTPYIPGRKVSKVKSIDVKKGDAWSLAMGVGAGQMGDGGPVDFSDLRHC